MSTCTDEPGIHTRRIGKYVFELAKAPADEDRRCDERWEKRSEALAAWLLAQWEHEQRQRAAERN